MEPKHHVALSLGIIFLYVALYIAIPRFRKTSLDRFEGLVGKALGVVILIAVTCLFIRDMNQ